MSETYEQVERRAHSYMIEMHKLRSKLAAEREKVEALEKAGRDILAAKWCTPEYNEAVARFAALAAAGRG